MTRCPRARALPSAVRRKLLRAPFALSLLAFASVDSLAQTAASSEPAASAVETVTITGKALSTRKAIADKRYEPVVSDGVSADDIGSIPDFGLGEALQRVPGVSMILNNGRGEAQFMTLRGFNPDYNSVLVDGVALPSTETTRRTVSFDVLPASLSKQVTVYKTFTPEMDGNAIGGITDLHTRSAFDQLGFHVSTRGDLVKWQNQRNFHGTTPSGQLEGTVSNTFGDDNRFGALLSASYFRRDSSSLLTSVDSYSYFPATGNTTNAAKLNPATKDVDEAVAMPDRVRWLSYDNLRQRKALFSKLEFDDHDAFRAHLAAGLFQHLNDEDRRAQWIQNTTTSASAVDLTSPTSGSAASGQSQSDYAKFDQNRRIRYGELGAEFQPRDDRLVDFTVNRAIGSYRQDAHLYTFASANSAKLGYSYTYVPGDVPEFTPGNTAFLLDPANYNQTENTVQRETSTNAITTLKLDFAQNLQDGSRGWGYKAGLQSRNLKQLYNFDESKFVPKTGAPITMAAVGAAPFDVNPYDSGGRALLLPDPDAAAAYFQAHQSSYAPAATNTQNSTQKDFGIQEDVASAYALTAYRAQAWSSIFGLRYERTRQEVNTFVASPANQTTLYAPSSTSRVYGNALPSFSLNYDLSQVLRLRAGASETLARPTYAQLGQNSSSVTGTTISQTLANPQLAPRKSTNLDLSLEWYWSRDSLLSAALFHKAIRDEIANLTSTQTSTIGTTNFTVNATQAQNVGDAGVNGIELGMMATRFSFLPAPFDQFGATFNLTLLDMTPSLITMGNGTQRRMPSLIESAKSTMNASLMWGDGPFGAQLSYNRTGKTLITLSTTNSAQDVYYDTLGTFDAQLSYRFDKRLGFVVQGKNLTDARPTRITGPNQGLLNQEFDNGRAFFVGVTYAL